MTRVDVIDLAPGFGSGGSSTLDWARWSKQDAVFGYLGSVMPEADRSAC